MTLVDILDCYEEVKDDLKSQNASGVRIKIMICLSEGPKKIEDLIELTGMQSPGMIYCIKKLEKKNLVLNEKSFYHLSKIGANMASELIDVIKTLIVLKKSRELWLNHSIDAIPQELLVKIGDLSNSQLIKSENVDVAKIHDTHTKIVLNAKEVKGVSPIFYSDYIETFNNILEKGVEVELILTEDVLKKTIESHDTEGLKNIKKLILENQLKIWKSNEDIKVAFTITDKFMTLGLSSINGIHDATKNLISDHKDAITWGNKLFDHYLQKSQKVNSEDF